MYTHLWWHLAFLLLELGRLDDALAVFDGQLWRRRDRARWWWVSVWAACLPQPACAVVPHQATHAGITCDVCKQEIRGEYRWAVTAGRRRPAVAAGGSASIQTGDWDVCAACYATKLDEADRRCLVRLTSPAPRFGFDDHPLWVRRAAITSAALAVVDGANAEVQLCALQLLARLHVRGAPGLAPRWQSVLAAIGDAPLPKQPLHNVLRVFGLAATGARESTIFLNGLHESARRADDLPVLFGVSHCKSRTVSSARAPAWPIVCLPACYSLPPQLAPLSDWPSCQPRASCTLNCYFDCLAHRRSWVLGRTIACMRSPPPSTSSSGRDERRPRLPTPVTALERQTRRREPPRHACAHSGATAIGRRPLAEARSNGCSCRSCWKGAA